MVTQHRMPSKKSQKFYSVHTHAPCLNKMHIQLCHHFQIKTTSQRTPQSLRSSRSQLRGCNTIKLTPQSSLPPKPQLRGCFHTNMTPPSSLLSRYQLRGGIILKTTIHFPYQHTIKKLIFLPKQTLLQFIQRNILLFDQDYIRTGMIHGINTRVPKPFSN